jgi:hydroxymethylglutaryl-CoA reductase (NADPH)
MPQSLFRSRQVSGRILAELDVESARERLRPKAPADKPLPRRLPQCNNTTAEGLARRRAYLAEQGIATDALCGDADVSPEALKGNIENYIGFCQIPVGVIGPLRVNGLYANGDYFVPLATTEGAMVASYHRGAHVISQSGGTSVMCLSEAMSRAPCFVFTSIVEAGLFLNWLYGIADRLPETVAQVTEHGQLLDIKTAMNGAAVYLIFEYSTGDASGQNMVTVATDKVCRLIVKDAPIKPQRWYLEGNLSGDKKASMVSFLGVRGRKVIAETMLPEPIIRHFLHTTAAEMARYSRHSAVGGIQSGSIGVQGQYANALAALFLACGQDVACVSEASVGLTTMEEAGDGALYAAVSLPNLTVGTVGGGTHLPTAQACLGMLGCVGTGTARKFAEICVATVLAGEISIIAALAAGEFGRAHATFRHKPGS